MPRRIGPKFKCAALHPDKWTYGCEHELADLDTRKGWEPEFGRDPEPNIVNSNGIAADPRLISYHLGAELTTLPTDSIEGQVIQLERIKERYPEASINYRTGMHVHIRVPGLKDDLWALKVLQAYIYDNSDVYEYVDVLPDPRDCGHYPDPVKKKMAIRRYHWMRRSHMTVIPGNRVDAQLEANTPQEFFEAEVPRSKTGKILWHAQPRAAVNLRQLLQTDTIEFRHFCSTLDPEVLRGAIYWCKRFLETAFLATTSAIDLYQNEFVRVKFPSLGRIINTWQEERWLATTISKNKRPVLEANIERLLKDEEWPPGETS